MTKEQMNQLAQAQLNAYNARDLEAFCKCYHAEVEVVFLGGGRTPTRGMSAFKETYRSLFECNPKLHCELKSRITLEDSVLDEEWVTGNARFPDGLHVVAVYGFRDGLIDRVWFLK